MGRKEREERLCQPMPPALLLCWQSLQGQASVRGRAPADIGTLLAPGEDLAGGFLPYFLFFTWSRQRASGRF